MSPWFDFCLAFLALVLSGVLGVLWWVYMVVVDFATVGVLFADLMFLSSAG